MLGAMRQGTSLWDGAVLALLAALSATHALYFSHLADDAYISFRFAANFADGHGLVFNPGERVMGYSNFLWVLGLGGLEALGWRSPSAAPVVGIALGWGILALLYGHVRAAFGSRVVAAAAAALLATNATFALWLAGGLEGPLFGLGLTTAVVLALRIHERAPLRSFGVLGVVFGLTAWTRPEGVFYAVPVGLWLVLREPTAQRLRGVAVFAGVVAASYALFLGGAWAYYGDPMPNPFYAKYHPLSLEVLSRGAVIGLWFVEGYWGWPLLVVGMWAGLCGRSLRSPGWLPVLLIAAFVVFFLRVGGDGQAYYRMWFWMLPMFALLFGEALGRLSAQGDRRARVWGAAFAGVVLVFNLQHSLIGGELERVRRDESLGQDAVLIAERLAEAYPDARVAANNVGVLSYVSGLPVLDMLGLTDRHIAKAPGKPLGFPAHESHDGQYVLDQEPDIIFYGIPLAYPGKPSRREVLSVAYPSDLDLREDPRFERDYRLHYLDLGDGRFSPLFRRRDRS